MIGNILAIAMALACIFSLYGDYVLVPGLNRASLIAYQALSRPVWSISVSWLLFLCSTNQGGIINRILSFPIWAPFARLNYAAYLIHSTVIFVTLFNLTTPLYYQPMTFLNNYVSQLFFSYLAAIVVVIFFETPFFILEKRIFKR
jgi:peptidoglycan/LPS O-acetylase OafA/YrhL